MEKLSCECRVYELVDDLSFKNIEESLAKQNVLYRNISGYYDSGYYDKQIILDIIMFPYPPPSLYTFTCSNFICKYFKDISSYICIMSFIF